MSTPVIPNRPVFRAQEVCEIADVQPYVLRSWEAEFADLGVAKAGGPRMYRRADVEKVLRLKHLLFVDGLTLAGARKQLQQERGSGPAAGAIDDADVAAMLDEEARQSLLEIRGGLQWILGVLSGQGAAADQFTLQPQRVARPAAPRRAPPPARAKAVKKKARKK